MQALQITGKRKFSLLFTLLSLVFTLLMASCSEAEKPEEIKPEVLTEIKDGVFTEYYPGRKHIKFQGMLNDDKQREGKWVYYSEGGNELSITFYENGNKQGHTIVKYPNGRLYYFGEYNENKKVGVWKTYGTDGKLLDSTDFGGL